MMPSLCQAWVQTESAKQVWECLHIQSPLEVDHYLGVLGQQPTQVVSPGFNPQIWTLGTLLVLLLTEGTVWITSVCSKYTHIVYNQSKKACERYVDDFVPKAGWRQPGSPAWYIVHLINWYWYWCWYWYWYWPWYWYWYCLIYCSQRWMLATRQPCLSPRRLERWQLSTL